MDEFSKEILDLKFVVEDKTVKMKVRKQPDFLRNYHIETLNGNIKASSHPGLALQTSNTIYLRGADKSKDTIWAMETFPSHKEAVKAALHMVKLVHHFCKTCLHTVKPTVDYHLFQNGRYLAFAITHQEGIPRGEYTWEPVDGRLFDIKSRVQPWINDGGTIYIRGTNVSKDDGIYVLKFKTAEECKRVAQTINLTFDVWKRRGEVPITVALQPNIHLEVLS